MGTDATVMNVHMNEPRGIVANRRIKARPVEVNLFNQLPRTFKADFGYRNISRSSQYVLRIRDSADLSIMFRVAITAVDMNRFAHLSSELFKKFNQSTVDGTLSATVTDEFRGVEMRAHSPL